MEDLEDIDHLGREMRTEMFWMCGGDLILASRVLKMNAVIPN
jgi:hypothetical protein